MDVFEFHNARKDIKCELVNPFLSKSQSSGGSMSWSVPAVGRF